MQRAIRLRAASETCETLLAPGKKWHLSPYVDAALSAAGMSAQAFLIPVYQSVLLDLLTGHHLPSDLSILDLGSLAGIGGLAALDVLLAWCTACAIYDISPGIEQVGVYVVDRKSEDKPALWGAFRNALQARVEALPDLEYLSLVARWAGEPSASMRKPPNLILVSLPWEQTTALDFLLERLPEGAIVAGIDWQSSGSEGNVFQWRRQLLQRRRDWVALGPCGQEYGRELPEACETCFHGRREKTHRPDTDLDQEQITPAWTYAIVAKRTTPVEPLPDLLISADVLAQVVTGDVCLRYVGAVREQVIPVEHPDEASDNPNDQKWREYLKVCPGHSGATRVAIERRAGMQTPRLRYGQWLQVADLQPQRPYEGHPDIHILRVRNEAAFHAFEGLAIADTFVESYTPIVRAAVDEASFRLFGFSALYEFQHTILARTLCGHDILAIAATGGGKSECYILPSMLLPGITVVVAPLKSLILDQYEQRIRDRYGLDHLTTFIDGDVPFYERQGRLRRTVLGHFKLIYMTPEQLERGYVLDALRQADQQVGLRYLAMDEAHCISQWGHDFRPSYLNIVQRLQDYGLRPCRIALTATASPPVRDDVCSELHLDERDLSSGGDVFIDSSNRPELNLVVKRVRSTEQKARIIVEYLQRLDRGSAIVFMPHTGGTPDRPRDLGAPVSDPRPANAGMVSPGVTPFARYLSQQIGQPVAMYHGALGDESSPSQGDTNDTDDDGTDTHVVTRQAEQRDFMAGRKRIMVATKGFGMGVDKPDIRLVIHRSPPANLEAYVQEAGRAGRDGKSATVMLLASDDRPAIAKVLPDIYLGRTSLPSDRDIQQYFTEQRYVRRQDVEAMLAFLHSDGPRRVNGALYFTNDQVMNFLDRCERQPSALSSSQPYTWPSFPPRRKSGIYESRDHQQILDRGHVYTSKRSHIGRILAVLFNNRPTIGGRLLPVVRSVHETGTLLRRFRLHNPERIIESPAYFGDRLRRAGVDARELRELLPNGDFTDLTPLALRLSLSLRETASMLKDIRCCEGRTGKNSHWIGTLLDFWWIEAPRWVSIPSAYEDLAAWRNHAGACRRAKPPSGRNTLDDYFPWSVVNLPFGWEVTSDIGFEYSDQPAYLEALMILHDERRSNDENNFAYLLDRYVGSGDDASQCLRSLVLGYLKTNEVVIGGSCYGCSVCVPDLDFDRYPLIVRRDAVARLMPGTIALMEQVEAGNRTTPATSLLNHVLEAVAREEAQGRSGTAYLDSWLARLVQDDPEHQSALWLRLYAHEREVLNLSFQDLLAAVERLVRLTKELQNLAQLGKTIERYRHDPRYGSLWLPLTVQMAHLMGRLEDWKTEVDLWRQVLDSTGSVKQDSPQFGLLRLTLKRLLQLHRPDGPLPDRKQAAEIGLRLARMPGGPLQEAQIAYSAVVPGWQWCQVEAELRSAESLHPSAALLAWLETTPNADQKAAISWLVSSSNIWSDWPLDALQALGERLAPSLDRSSDLLLALADAVVQKSEGRAASAQYLLRAWCAGADLSPSQFEDIATSLAILDVDWCRRLLKKRKKATGLLVRLWQVCGGDKLPSEWLERFPSAAFQEFPDEMLRRLVETSVARQIPLEDSLLIAVRERMARSDGEEPVGWVGQLATQHPELATGLLRTCLSNDTISPRVVCALFSALLEDRSNQRTIAEILDRLSTDRKLVSGGPRVVSLCLDNWGALREDMQVWSLLRRFRIEGSTLVETTRRWLDYKDKLHRIDMLIVILKDVRRDSSPNWLTPVSLEFEALCASGRFSEAQRLLNLYPDLRIKGQDAADYLKGSHTQVAARTAAYESEFRRLWQLIDDQITVRGS